MYNLCPFDIGFLFTYTYTGVLTRMMMDGSKGLLLTAKNVFPNAVALDVRHHQILSLEYQDEYLVASDYSGKALRTIRVMGENSHEIELGDDRIYWLGDPTRRKVYSTSLNGSEEIDVFDIGQGLTILNFVVSFSKSWSLVTLQFKRYSHNVVSLPA